MKALVLTGTKKMEIQDLPTPEVKPNEVLVNTAYAGICGTDRALYAGLPGSADAVPPIVLGHENSGIVAAIGSDVTNVKVGDHVTVDPNIYCGECDYCRTDRPELCDNLSAVGVTRDGGLEKSFTAPASVVYPLPDNVSLKAAATTEPISCAVHGVKLLDLTPYQNALVIGDGFMGQIFVQLLQAYGVHQVDLAGLNDKKLAFNKEKFGVTNTYNTKRESIPADYDVVIEAVGLPQTQEQAVEATKKGAQVLMFGVGKPDQTFSMNTYEVYQKQLKIQGAFINPYAFEDAIALLASGQLDVESLISHEVSLEQVEDVLNGKVEGVSKAVVKVSD
ncbi:zinc-dependent alcohol dehydrogenase family protein [Levilactobacillus tujiorum]|uniref:Zinc-dependent alcohol dehydrogenase family protein n=1 Tax=Levilactobacillus tujiorum TaxID=2912243 RepID=A0ABX1L4S2_9LACO|nr:zinc-dependent alcohol dehydrogenase family protein [Levilactobacillus tujiorum]MCH5464352.1 zinc-dependent alcohol dehydrogenase family protein [Levilactobacillus tujiorum]NLR11371.1 zinc-dependent alcohol dehydrogenase family protein [Lactobacillus sp. HBUAS51387]NLR29331.1 zinc-dependent alcohol dehydrogenase family protein [Levilactobacillus tujiorum]NLR32087.1 zinc-dependent alcohol dehydrogenase family protein [Levilactobacillus tujiorum]